MATKSMYKNRYTDNESEDKEINDSEPYKIVPKTINSLEINLKKKFVLKEI